MSQIHDCLIAIMRDTPAIAKASKNTSQNFKFRGIDAVMNDLHSIFAKHGVFILPESVGEPKISEHKTASGGAMFRVWCGWKFRFVAGDGSEISCSGIGEAMDSADKATNKSQSAALKYALLQMFLIPTEEQKDADFDSPEVLPTSREADKQFLHEKIKSMILALEPERIEKGLAVLEKTSSIDDLETLYKQLGGK